MEKVLLIGGGAHCASVIDSMKKQALYEPVGILDTPDKVGASVLGVPIIGVDADMAKHHANGIRLAFVTLGSIGNTRVREKLVRQAEALGFSFPTIIDPSAIVSDAVSIGAGTFIGKGVIVNVHAEVGGHAIVNSGSIVEHDCRVGGFVHLAPGTTMSGGVTVGDHAHVGTNTTIIQSITIGDRALIGAGSVVIRDIGADKKAYGNPCREVEA